LVHLHIGKKARKGYIKTRIYRYQAELKSAPVIQSYLMMLSDVNCPYWHIYWEPPVKFLKLSSVNVIRSLAYRYRAGFSFTWIVIIFCL